MKLELRFKTVFYLPSSIVKSYPSKLKQVNEKIGIGKILSMQERHANQRCGENLAVKGPALSLLLFFLHPGKN